MKRIFCWPLFLVIFLTACGPREPIVFRSVRNIKIETVANNEALLTAYANLYNPNNLRVRLKQIKVDVFVDGKKSAVVDQKLKAVIKAKSDFIVPLEMRISMKDLGLLDTILSLIGGRKYQIHFKGYLKLKVRGIPVRVPIDYSDEVRLRL
jgi:LEA14-like dessication related protein